MMSSDDVRDALDRIERAGLKPWVSGGWGVDALIGSQTRPHDDLDLVLTVADCASVAAALPGFRHDLGAQPGMPHRYVLIDDRGRTIDIHPVLIAASGDAVAADDPRTVLFTADSLTGQGAIGARPVRCLSAEGQVVQHSGYTNHGPDDYDYLDMRALAERCGVRLPREYDQVPGWRHARRARIDSDRSGPS
jgi:lincosamide nucleotidyltransferase A/C/D/E